jgi:MFS family permease
MTTAFHSGVLIGPSIGGLLIDYVHWRAVFFFLIPIAMAGIVLTLINRWKGNAPETLPIAEANGTIDYLGAVLLICATVTLVACVDHRIMEALCGLRLWPYFSCCSALFFSENTRLRARYSTCHFSGFGCLR